MTRPYTTDPITALALPRNQRTAWPSVYMAICKARAAAQEGE